MNKLTQKEKEILDQMHMKMTIKINWGNILFDLIILVSGLTLSLYFNNPKYLWLWILILFIGGDYLYESI